MDGRWMHPLGQHYVIPVTCPKIACEFLKKQDAIRGYLTIATAPSGHQWKKMRRAVAGELLDPAKLRWLLRKRTREADNLLRCIHTQCFMNSGDAVVNVREAAQRYCGNVMRKLMFNVRYFGAGRAWRKKSTWMHSLHEK
ncbi:hypothetical protein ACLOJK_012206 [Asimina triloba]